MVAKEAFRKWLKTVDLTEFKIENLQDCIEFLWCQGYDTGRENLWKEVIEGCKFCNQRLEELQDENLELLAELAAKNIEKKN